MKAEEILRLGYLADFGGRAGSSSIRIPADKTIRLPDQPCRFAMLSLWNAEDLPTFPPTADAGGSAEAVYDDETEIYYGFGGRLFSQLFVASNSPMFPIANLNQISVRCRPSNSATLWYSWFW